MYHRSSEKNRKSERPGFTLVELLVVIAIIGVLVALLLPAVQAAREAARRNTCKNHLKQIALGALNHESSIGHFPTGGWTTTGVGDADRGCGKGQPGGGMYNSLPFIEQQALYELSSDGDANNITQVQLDGALQILIHPVDTFTCPSRRPGGLFNFSPPDYTHNTTHYDEGEVFLVGRGDYAANCGDIDVNSLGKSPALGQFALATGQTSGSYNWPVIGTLGELRFGDDDRMELSGVSFMRSEVGIQHISDGLSNTYYVGERHVVNDHYETGEDGADNETWCTGFDNDNYRNSFYLPLQDSHSLPAGTEHLEARFRQHMSYGSAHPSNWHMAMCDGSVHTMNYDIDLEVHRNLGNRADGHVVQIP